MSGLEGKPFAIPEQVVWQAWKSVKANGGAAGADGVTIEMFEKDLKDTHRQRMDELLRQVLQDRARPPATAHKHLPCSIVLPSAATSDAEALAAFTETTRQQAAQQ